MTTPPSKYHDGETDALLRQNRAYLRLIDDDETPSDRKKHLTAVMAQNFRELDHWLSQGHPLPIEWRWRAGVEVAGQIATAPTEKEASEEGTKK